MWKFGQNFDRRRTSAGMGKHGWISLNSGTAVTWVRDTGITRLRMSRVHRVHGCRYDCCTTTPWNCHSASRRNCPRVSGGVGWIWRTRVPWTCWPWSWESGRTGMRRSHGGELSNDSMIIPTSFTASLHHLGHRRHQLLFYQDLPSNCPNSGTHKQTQLCKLLAAQCAGSVKNWIVLGFCVHVSTCR